MFRSASAMTDAAGMDLPGWVDTIVVPGWVDTTVVCCVETTVVCCVDTMVVGTVVKAVVVR